MVHSKKFNTIRFDMNIFRKIPGLLTSLNCLGMLVILALLIYFGYNMLSGYTHHGESTKVPNVFGKSYDEAKKILEDAGLTVEVSDTGFVDSLKANVVLTQSLRPGDNVKPGRIIELSVNADHPLPKPLPDLAENSSLREAQARLLEEGFKLGEVEYVPSPDRDWVIAVKSNGKNVMAGDLVSVVTPVVLVVGDGKKVEVFNGEEYTKDPEFKTDTVLVTELGSLGEGDVILDHPEYIGFENEIDDIKTALKPGNKLKL